MNNASNTRGIYALSALFILLILIPTVYYFPFWELNPPVRYGLTIEKPTLGPERLFIKVPLAESTKILLTVFPTSEVAETQSGLRISGNSLLRHLEEHGIASATIWDEIRREDPALLISDDFSQITFPIRRDEAGTRYVSMPAAIVAVAIS